MLQTDLYSFSYKKGSIVPWCKKCGAQDFYRAGKTKDNKQRYRSKGVILDSSGAVTCQEETFSVMLSLSQQNFTQLLGSLCVRLRNT